ncbi:hypothetical protein C0V75_17735 [Tabrizicola sp. TH137]|uniref:TadE/TadG family type IV pilus assembly protein n=1 Tax=Tabrizicola sp. TH137 TaxID=2067452 RepID=UPI000C7DA730|nr:TadE/TadG family type IV pilus assembly protein [Tabrizicola sp. TH137]PLL11127.1 hypothetical protein C0V75_17735 [Tabrizicola sp. TH137]
MTRMIRSLLRRFRDRSAGSVTVEAAFVLPMLAMGLFGFFAFWDVYRTQNMVQKGTYAVADMLSREMIPATPAFIDGLEDTLEFLIQAEARIRVTSVRRVSDGPAGAQGIDVLWSYSPGNVMEPITEATLSLVEPDIPMMAIGSNMVIFEAVVPYAPVTDLLEVDSLEEIVAMRPRFLPTLCLQGTIC